MDRFNEFLDFFNNPYSKEMTKNFGMIANYASTVLLSFTHLFDDITKDDEKSQQTANQCLDMIRTISGQLQRTGIFCSALMNDNTKLRQISAESYLNSFTSGCERILGEKCTVSAAVQQDFIIVTSRELLDLLLLGFIRKSCGPKNFAPKSDADIPVFDISTGIKNGIPQITVNTSTEITQTKSDPFGSYEFFESFFDEFSSLIAKKLHIEIDTGSNYMTIKFTPNEYDDMITFNSPTVQLAGEGRSIFRIMLEDLDTSQQT